MNKKAREILLFVFSIFIFLMVTIYTSSDKAVNYPDYTTFSANNGGASLLFDGLKAMGFPVEASLRYINDATDINDIQIIIAPSFLYYDENQSQEIADWVLKGGNLLFFEEDLSFTREYLKNKIDFSNFITNGSFTRVKHGLGNIYFGNADEITNKALMESPEKGQIIVNIIGLHDYNKIYFNESYHGYAVSERLWDGLPFMVKLACIQIFIITAACVLYFGKRFGRPLPLYEEDEREENEYVYTLSNLYIHAGMGEAAVNAYADKFLESARIYFSISHTPTLEEVYTLWLENNLDKKTELEYLKHNLKTSYDTKKAKERKEFYKAIEYLKSLNFILSKLK